MIIMLVPFVSISSFSDSKSSIYNSGISLFQISERKSNLLPPVLRKKFK